MSHGGALSGWAGGPSASIVSGYLQIECGERKVDQMATHVAQPAVAEIPPPTPMHGMVGGMVRAIGGRAQPEVPIQVCAGTGGVPCGRFRPRRLPSPAATLGGSSHSLSHQAWTSLTCPIVRPESTSTTAAVDLRGVPCIAKLGGQAVPLGHACDLADFVDVVAEWFLGVAVLAHLHGHHGGGDVDVVRRGDHDGVDVILFPVKQLAKVTCTFWRSGNVRKLSARYFSSTSHKATML